ncbi:MAG: hypothetical protein KDD43_17400, partial [Bdellovibrionales bacterium]|nr:hypothetical protein [Bdellovibrionales bacterium]
MADGFHIPTHYDLVKAEWKKGKVWFTLLDRWLEPEEWIFVGMDEKLLKNLFFESLRKRKDFVLVSNKEDFSLPSPDPEEAAKGDYGKEYTCGPWTPEEQKILMDNFD